MHLFKLLRHVGGLRSLAVDAVCLVGYDSGRLLTVEHIAKGVALLLVCINRDLAVALVTFELLLELLDRLVRLLDGLTLLLLQNLLVIPLLRFKSRAELPNDLQELLVLFLELRNRAEEDKVVSDDTLDVDGGLSGVILLKDFVGRDRGVLLSAKLLE